MYSFITLPNSKSILKLKRNLNEESIPTGQIGTTLLKGLLTTTVLAIDCEKAKHANFHYLSTAYSSRTMILWTIQMPDWADWAASFCSNAVHFPPYRQFSEFDRLAS